MEFAEKVFFKYLKERGFYNTAQRRLVVQEFLRLEGHVCSDELYRAVKKKHPRVGQTTVFRTVKLLKEAKLAAEVNFTGKRRRFEHEWGHRHHDHLICVGCGRTIEFANKQIEKIQQQVTGSMNFQPLHHRLEIFGHCLKCRKEKGE